VTDGLHALGPFQQGGEFGEQGFRARIAVAYEPDDEPGQQVGHARLVPEHEAPARGKALIEPAQLGAQLGENMRHVRRDFGEVAARAQLQAGSATSAGARVRATGANTVQNASSNSGPSVQRESAKGRPAPLFGKKLGDGARRSSSRRMHSQ